MGLLKGFFTDGAAGPARDPVAAMAAAVDVFGWHQVTELDNLFRFFLCHFLLFSCCFGLPRILVLRTHFWPFTEVVRRIGREVTQKNWEADEPRIAQTPRIGEIEKTKDPDARG